MKYLSWITAQYQAAEQWWKSLSEGVQSALIQGGFTLVAAFLGATFVIAQIRASARQQAAAIKAAEARRLRSEMFEQCLRVSNDMITATSDLYVQLVHLDSELAWLIESQKDGNKPTPIITRHKKIMQRVEAWIQAASRFIALVEARQVVDLRLIVFRDAMCAVSNDVSKAMHGESARQVALALPIDQDEGPPLYPVTITPVLALTMQHWAKRAAACVDDAEMIASDFQVEMQNLLMSDLFGNAVPHRVPGDPMHGVLRLDRSAEQQRWIAENTAWGRNIKDWEARTASGVQSAAPVHRSTLYGIGAVDSAITDSSLPPIGPAKTGPGSL